MKARNVLGGLMMASVLIASVTTAVACPGGKKHAKGEALEKNHIPFEAQVKKADLVILGKVVKNEVVNKEDELGSMTVKATDTLKGDEPDGNIRVPFYKPDCDGRDCDGDGLAVSNTEYLWVLKKGKNGDYERVLVPDQVIHGKVEGNEVVISHQRVKLKELKTFLKTPPPFLDAD